MLISLCPVNLERERREERERGRKKKIRPLLQDFRRGIYKLAVPNEQAITFFFAKKENPLKKVIFASQQQTSLFPHKKEVVDTHKNSIDLNCKLS